MFFFLKRRRHRFDLFLLAYGFEWPKSVQDLQQQELLVGFRFAGRWLQDSLLYIHIPIPTLLNTKRKKETERDAKGSNQMTGTFWPINISFIHSTTKSGPVCVSFVLTNNYRV